MLADDIVSSATSAVVDIDCAAWLVVEANDSTDDVDSGIDSAEVIAD